MPDVILAGNVKLGKNLHKKGETVAVSDSVLKHLQSSGAIAAVLEDKPQKPATDFSSMTVAELKSYAEEKDVDLGSATKKAEIIKVLMERDAQ